MALHLGLCLNWSEIPKCMFSRDVAHIHPEETEVNDACLTYFNHSELSPQDLEIILLFSHLRMIECYLLIQNGRVIFNQQKNLSKVFMMSTNDKIK